MAAISNVSHERIDDSPCVIGLCQQLRWAEVLNRQFGKHGLQQGLNNGQLCVGWLGYILSQANHHKVAVEEWAERREYTLGQLFNQPLRAGDFGDDRLGRLLTRLSRDAVWEAIEAELWAATVVVHEIELKGIRLDSTTSYGHHHRTEEGIMQFGVSKDHRPDLPQLKLMAAAAEPSGHLIASDVYPGQRADDPLYTPLIRRVRELLSRKGLLYTGDCKMSALQTRAELVSHEDYYLTPLTLTGKNGETFEAWVDTVVEGSEPATLIWQARTLLGAAYEFERSQQITLNHQELAWTERVLMVRSLSLVRTQQASLERRLEAATTELLALTPAPARGRQQIRKRVELEQRIEQVLHSHHVMNLLEVTWEVQHKTRKRYPGRGRGSRARPVVEIVQTRYVITAVHRLLPAITAASYRLGWRVLLTNTPVKLLSLEQAICHYRGGWCLERDFHLLKDLPLGWSPLFVCKNDQITGLTRLLTLALRLLTLVELQVRHVLKQNNTALAGLYEGQPRRLSKRPSGKRLLRAFARAEITLTKFETDQGIFWSVTPLPELLQNLLTYLNLPASLYTDLAAHS